ncbi:hypothetical protein H2200_008720 [Cladophialophora chaetospira]|uniref:Myb-like DNA-binding domain-containing protein n=1 Tax=Cladophialophora chaetospira TaxID=386627 RepID=A0AA39CFZ7_9EURO|nr:hypothetical protein H2200_008720 [Cladophialophora chaetospira]
MPQLQYLNPDDNDDDWDSSPSPEPSPSPLVQESLHESIPSAPAGKIASRSPDGTITAPNSSPRSPPAESASSQSTAAGFGQPYDHVWNASGPSTSSLQRLPSPAPYDHIPAQSPGPRAAKRVKTEVIDLDSEPEISQTVQGEDSRSPSPSPNSKLLNSFINNVPRVTKDEWSDDSSDELQAKQEEDDFEPYHKPRARIPHVATPDFMYLETDQAAPPLDRVGSSDTVNVSRKYKGEENATTDQAEPKKRPSYYSMKYQFPKIARRHLDNYIFLAACVKHAGDRFRPDIDAVGKDCGISPSSVGNKLRKLKKKLDEEGPTFGHPDDLSKPRPYGWKDVRKPIEGAV